MYSKTYCLFGSTTEFYADSDSVVCEPLFDEAYCIGLRLQNIFNFYDPKSEVSRLNDKREILASDELVEVLRYAINMSSLSCGKYDVTLGHQFIARKNAIKHSDSSCCKVLETENNNSVHIDGNAIRLSSDALIDFGSLAKGYIAEKMALSLVSNGIESGYIDARGDIRVFGERRIVGVAHPRREGLLLSICVKDKGIATSGDYKQHIGKFSHIVNQNEIISATVVSDNLMQADAIATVLMVCDDRVKIMKKLGFPAMVVDKNLKIEYFNEFDKLVCHEK